MDVNLKKYFKENILPFNPLARIDEKSIKKGYVISFLKQYHKSVPYRSLTDISQEILELESKTEGLLKTTLSI